MLQSRFRGFEKERAAGLTPVVLPPGRLRRIRVQMRSGDAVVCAPLKATQPGKEALGLIRAGTFVRIRERMVDPLRFEAITEDVPAARLIRMDDAIRRQAVSDFGARHILRPVDHRHGSGFPSR